MILSDFGITSKVVLFGVFADCAKAYGLELGNWSAVAKACPGCFCFCLIVFTAAFRSLFPGLLEILTTKILECNAIFYP